MNSAVAGDGLRRIAADMAPDVIMRVGPYPCKPPKSCTCEAARSFAASSGGQRIQQLRLVNSQRIVALVFLLASGMPGRARGS